MTDKKSKQNNAPANDSSLEKKDKEKQPTSTDADESQKTRKPRRRSAASGFSSLIIFVLFVGVMAALAYWVEKQQQELATHNRYQIDQLRNELAPALEQLKADNRELQQRLSAEEESQQALQQALSNLLKTRRHLRNDWLLAEADYLLRLASHRLLLARDSGSALAAMQAADERLHDMSDPAVIPVRKKLAEDINRLRAVPAIDIAGLSARLSALTESVDSLPLLDEYIDTNTDTDNKPENTPPENWQQLPKAIWADIRKLLVIRERHGKVIPLLSPEQHFFLSENLKLQLEQARLALLNAEQAVYQERLQTASNWVGRFFKPDDPASQAMRSELQQLAAEKIKPALPDISASYRALQDLREQQANRDDEHGGAS